MMAAKGVEKCFLGANVDLVKKILKRIGAKNRNFRKNAATAPIFGVFADFYRSASFSGRVATIFDP